MRVATQWISSNERKQIEARLEGFVDALMVSGAGVVGLARLLAKPLRPLWISQSSRIWIDQASVMYLIQMASH